MVVKAVNRETNETVAIKKFKENGRSFIKRELKMLNTLKSCEFVINLKEAFRRNEKIYFIFEYVERVSFHTVFKLKRIKYTKNYVYYCVIMPIMNLLL